MQYFIKTFGCQMNVYDSEKIGEILHASLAMTAAKSEDEADLVIFNTCSIREKAEEKLYTHLGATHKRSRGRKRMIAVGGCVATQEGERIRKRAPYVNIIFGPQTIQRLPAMIRSHLRLDDACMDIAFTPMEKFDALPDTRKPELKSFVSIMEGCSKFCSYCIVPYTRGKEVSRSFDSTLIECANLVDKGVREIHLLGQNVNAYRGLTHDGKIADLAILIEYISKIKNVERIRFTTSHPAEFSQRIIDLYDQVPALVSHLHLPVQHASARILRLMERGYTKEIYCDIINKIRIKRPEISISSDFIVAFPGETDSEFGELMDMVDAIGFDNSFSFIYSKRPGTPAADMPCTLTMEVKKARLWALQAKIDASSKSISQGMFGKSYKILIEGPSSFGDTWMGRTENNRVIHLPREDFSKGSIVTANILEVLGHSLRGKRCL